MCVKGKSRYLVKGFSYAHSFTQSNLCLCAAYTVLFISRSKEHPPVSNWLFGSACLPYKDDNSSTTHKKHGVITSSVVEKINIYLQKSADLHNSVFQAIYWSVCLTFREYNSSTTHKNIDRVISEHYVLSIGRKNKVRKNSFFFSSYIMISLPLLDRKQLFLNPQKNMTELFPNIV